MAYIAVVPDGLLTLDVDAYVVDTNFNSVLNGFFTDVREIDGDIPATNEGGNGAVAENGETLTVPTADGDIEAEYIGPVVFSSANVTLGIPGLAGINIKINDIDGHLLRGEDGTVYAITDEPIDEDRLGVTVSVTIPLIGTITLIDVPLSEINESLATALDGIPILGPPFATLLRNAADLGQRVLDAAIINVANGSGELAVVCFARGTMISTALGLVAVEALKAGDLVETRDNGLQPVRWIGSIKMSAQDLQKNPNLIPIRISAGALGAGTPAADLLVSPQHRVLVRSKIAQKMFGTSEILVAAKQLLEVDGIDIATDLSEVEYFHFLFDQHEVVVSNGAETESLYTGPQAIKSVGPAALAEIYTLFPELQSDSYAPVPARVLANGRKGRQLTARHVQHQRALVS
ncbi:MAG: Hint domain-containing protein [Paracoccaceae bacterium]